MKKDIILVDCFSTIIKRNVSDKEIIYIWCKNLGDKYLIEPSILYKLFKKIRNKEVIKNKFTYNEFDFRLQTIISKMSDKLDMHITNFNKEQFITDAYNIYLDTEMESHTINDEIVLKLQNYISENKRIIVVSDFYCGKDALLTFFKNLKIDHLFNEIYTSSDYMRSKFSGRLYKKIIRDHKIKRNKLLMIGDNSISDIFNARIRRISALKVKSKKIKSEKELNEMIKYGINTEAYKNIFNQNDKKYNFSNYAFPLLLFTKRLYQNLVKTNKKDVFFLSREGWYLKQLFDIYCDTLREKGVDVNIRSHYFLASRNSMQGATLKPIEEEKFDYLFRTKFIKMSIYSFLYSISFTTDEIKMVEKSLNIDINKLRFNFPNTKDFQLLKENDTFKDLYAKKRISQRTAFAQYLKEFGVDYQKDGMVIVDVGFHGTMQDFLKRFFDKDIHITGYYIAYRKLWVGKKEFNKNEKYGLLYHKLNFKQIGNTINNHNKYDYENICCANHGRADEYVIKDGKVEVILDTKHPDAENHKAIFQPLQEEITSKFKELAKLDYLNLSYLEVDATKMFYKTIKNKSKTDDKWLYDSHHCYNNGFGTLGDTSRVLSEGIVRYALKLWNLVFVAVFFPKVKTLKIKI